MSMAESSTEDLRRLAGANRGWIAPERTLGPAAAASTVREVVSASRADPEMASPSLRASSTPVRGSCSTAASYDVRASGRGCEAPQPIAHREPLARAEWPFQVAQKSQSVPSLEERELGAFTLRRRSLLSVAFG